MFIDLRLLSLLSDARKDAQNGDRNAALSKVRAFGERLVEHQTMDDPRALTEMLGVQANILSDLGEWELARLKFEDLCLLAETIAPNTTETAGDFSSLSEACERLGDYVAALWALEQSAAHLNGTPDWSRYQGHYERRLAELRNLTQLG